LAKRIVSQTNSLSEEKTTMNHSITDQTIVLRASVRESIRSDIESLVGNVSFQVDIHADSMGKIGAAAIGKHLSVPDCQQLETFGRGQGKPFVLVVGLPTQTNLPNTPQQFHDDASVQFTDCLLLGAIELARIQPIAFLYENFGRVMRNVAPAKSESNAVSSHGSLLPLAFHTDNAYEFEGQGNQESPAPRFLCFAGLRNQDAHGKPVPTELLAVDSILNASSARTVRGLRRKAFRIMPGQSNDREPIGPVPLLEECQRTGESLLRLNVNEGQTIGLDTAAKRCLVEITEVIESLEASVDSILVNPGSILMFDNYRVLHRRSSFDPGELSRARWLRRCFACIDRSNGRRLDPIHRPFVWS
jgi:L-asparagine oxygenase